MTSATDETTSSSRDQNRQSKLWSFALLGLIVIAAVLVRSHKLDLYSLELDEFWNAEVATGRGAVHELVEGNRIYVPPPATSLAGAPPWWRIPASLDNWAHPPFYSIALRWWREVFDGDFAMRFFSVLLSSAAIIPFYAAVALLSGRTAALWSAALLAVAATTITIAQQVRPYNLFLLLECLAFWQMLRIRKFGATWRSAILLGVTCFLAAATHYFTVPILAAAAIFTALGLDRRSLVRCAGCIAAVTVIYALWWGPKILHQRSTVRESATVWLKDHAPAPIHETLARACTIPVRLLVAAPPSSRWLVQLGIALVPLTALLAIRRSDMRFWLLILAGSFGFVTMLDLLQGTKLLSLMRYSLPAAPAVAAVIGSAMIEGRRWMMHMLPAAVLGGALVNLSAAYEPVEPDFRPLARHLDARVDENDIVVFIRKDNWAWYSGFIYATWSHYTLKPTPRCLFLDGSATPAMINDLRRAAQVWLVSQDEPHGGAQRIPGIRVTEIKSFLGAADVARAEFAPSTTTTAGP